MKSTLKKEAKSTLEKLSKENRRFARRYPGDRPDRQPLHTVYGGAHLFKAETANKLGQIAMRVMGEYAPDAVTFARALSMLPSDRLDRVAAEAEGSKKRYHSEPDALRAADPDAFLVMAVYDRVRRKLEREAVEDFRIDFEDGYGNRPDEEEDATAENAAREVARGMKEGCLPPFLGIRVKPLNDELMDRSVRTLDIFLTTLIGEAGGLPDNFVVTLPKIPIPEQVEAMVQLLEILERRLGLERGALKLEMMIELTQTILDHKGRSNLPRLLEAADGRCVAAHFGTYDYTASCNITAAHQKITHPACDFALHMMKVAFAGTGVWLSDGATTVMPVAPHRGADVSPEQARENREAVHAAWKLSYDNVWHALENGYYQGWDLHPGQLPIRYAACYAFFLSGFNAAAERLSNFIDKAAQATLVGDVFDDAATGQGLLNYFLRGLNSGAVSLEELEVTGLTKAEIDTRSFVKILAGRSA